MFAAIMWYPGSPFPSELLSNDLSAPQVFHLKRDQIRALQITVYQQNPKLSPGPGQPLQMIRLAFGCRHNNLAYQQRLEASLQPDGSTWLAGHLITTSKLPRATKELGPTEARYLTRLAWLSQELIRD
ncbi:MAG TPA: hypothetical protein VLI05_07000 [Candidatus Saccharimonadia bacterium]|nr:hypothetical protein [Candidatus Saccharimonadia bacterium]